MTGSELYKLRLKNQLTQDKLAKILGCRSVTIYRYETGRINISDRVAAHVRVVLKNSK